MIRAQESGRCPDRRGNGRGEDDEALWLDPDVTDPPAVLPCLRPYPAEAMESYAVAPLVSSVRNDGPELVRPLTSP